MCMGFHRGRGGSSIDEILIIQKGLSDFSESPVSACGY
jgi:hypothetical protein